MAGTGKRTELMKALQSIASLRRMPFTLQMKGLNASTATSADVEEAGATDEGAGPDDDTAGQIQYESSLLHMGLDIARMSMQDKHILRPVLAKLGQGSQVMAGEQGRGARILVLYHAHLLSSESVLLLQACLEQNEGDLSVWMTSEMPVPQRIRDWFVEIPVAGTDLQISRFNKETPSCVATWPMIFRRLIDKWLGSPPPVLQDLKQVKLFVYEMLMRNLRWVEATHFLLDVILEHEGLTQVQRERAIKALASCDATGGGYTIPSYRIPILWEHLFLKLRGIFSLPEADAAPRPRRVSRNTTKPTKNTIQMAPV
jgi:hypothetical protein